MQLKIVLAEIYSSNYYWVNKVAHWMSVDRDSNMPASPYIHRLATQMNFSLSLCEENVPKV